MGTTISAWQSYEDGNTNSAIQDTVLTPRVYSLPVHVQVQHVSLHSIEDYKHHFELFTSLSHSTDSVIPYPHLCVPLES